MQFIILHVCVLCYLSYHLVHCLSFFCYQHFTDVTQEGQRGQQVHKGSEVSKPFLEYINQTACIDHYCAKWIVEPLGIYNPFCGVTNNVSESQ